LNNHITTFLTLTIGPMLVLFIYFNVFAGIIGSIWLLILGDWPAVIQCFLIGLFGYFIIGFASMPGGLIALLGIYCLKLNNIFGKILSIIPFLVSNILVIAIIAIWCMWIIDWVIGEFYTVSNEVPLLFLIFATVTSPLKQLTRVDGPDPQAAIMTTLVTQIGMFLYVIFIIFDAGEYVPYAFFGSILVLFLYQLVVTLSIIFIEKNIWDNEF
jgi:hypothetical protein